MNKLQEEFFENCESVGIFDDEDKRPSFNVDRVWKWINSNYVSREKILNLECLKEEKLIDDTKVDCMILEETWEDNDLKVIKNQLREEIIGEIKKL